MTKYVLNNYNGPELDYSTLGFRANVGDILDATGAPDARWSVNGDQGAAETVDRYTIGGFDPAFVEPTDGHFLVYRDTKNGYVPEAPETALAGPADGIMTTVAADPGSAFAGALSDRPAILANTARAYQPYLARWSAAVAGVRAGRRDAKLLCIGDSTTHGIGGGATDFQPRYSYPTYLADLLNRSVAKAGYGLAVPASSTANNDGRWTAGTGWTRQTDSLTNSIGWGSKATSWVGPAGVGNLTFNDPRVLADTFDVYYVVNSGATGGTVSASATGGATVTADTFSKPAKGIKKLTVVASAAETTNVVTITNTGSNSIYIVGIEPYLSTRKQIRVGNAGVSGSDSVGWVTNPDADVANEPWASPGAIRGYAPDLTIIDLGINDSGLGTPTPAATLVANIQILVNAAKITGDVIVKTMMPSSGRTATQDAYVAALLAMDVTVVNIYDHLGGEWQSTLMDDLLHPNATGYLREAQYVGAVLESVTIQDRTQVSLPQSVNIVGYAGDSITNGSGAAAGRGFVNNVCYIAGTRVVDQRNRVYATGGYTSAQVLATHIPSAVAGDAAVVHLQVGTNDATNSVPVADFAANVQACYDALRTAGKRMTIGLVPPRASGAGATWRQFRAAYNEWISRWAPLNGVPVADLRRLSNPATGYLSATYDTLNADGTGGAGDGTHPNTLGHAIIAEEVASAVVQALAVQPHRQVVAPDVNLISNGAPQTVAAGLPTGWTAVAGGTGDAPTYAVVADTGATLTEGNWVEADWNAVTAGGVQMIRAGGPVLDTGFTTGDQIEASATFEIEDVSGLAAAFAAGTAKIEMLALNTSDVATNQLTPVLLSPVLGPQAVRFAAAATTYPSIGFRFTIPTGVHAKFRVGEVGFRNLTAMGLTKIT